MKTNGVSFNLKEAFSNKMHESKLDVAEASRLKLVPTTLERTPDGLPFDEYGILIPYFDMGGKPTKFWRYRYLRQPEPKGFARHTEKKPLKYAQLAKSLNELYLPPVVNWPAVADDPMKPILITEGEFKAACACIHTEYPCIGLGGVWSWKSTNRKMPMIPGFGEFDWDGRPVYIIFDSDAVTNPMVMQAENALASALTDLGAEPHIVRLPMGKENAKVGLDDYIVTKGVDALEDLLENSEVYSEARELHRLNEDVVYVRDPGLILRLDNLQRMSPRAFTDHAYSTRIYYEEIVSGKSSKLVKKSAPREWMSWANRAEVPRMTYAPGEDRVTDKRELNVWPGWGCEPKAGSVKPWADMLDFLFKGEPVSRYWFERWCAYPLQYPGTKMYASPVLWGIRQGTGKSFIGYSLGKIYGKNFTEIGDDTLKESHNEWAENKQFVMGDEITTGDKRSASDRMKSMITRQLLRLNPKYIPSYTVPDVINYYFTSNHPDSFFMEDDDRRFFIHEVKGAPMPDEWYKAYEAWIGPPNVVGPGAPALFHHLLNLELGDFQSTTRALMTKSKTDMIDVGRSDLGAWVASLREDPNTVLRLDGNVLPFNLWRAEDLLRVYDPTEKSRVTINGMARELARQEFQRAAGGSGIRTRDGQCKLWIIRNLDELALMKFTKLGEYYDKERDGGTKRRVNK